MNTIQPIFEFDHRDNLLVQEMLGEGPIETLFPQALERVHQRYPNFQVLRSDFEPIRVRLCQGLDHYEFFMVKKEKNETT